MRIEGHADSRGEQAANQQLSQRRAEAVMLYLTQHGVDEGRIAMGAHGETAPVASNDSENGRQRNRRVEIETR